MIIFNNYFILQLSNTINIDEMSSIKFKIIKDNLSVFKRLARVSNIVTSKTLTNGVKIISQGETLILYFDQNIDLNEQKLKIEAKVKDISKKINSLKSKMKNKLFLKQAPKNIVEKEKKALKEHMIEFKKLNSILNSIKN